MRARILILQWRSFFIYFRDGKRENTSLRRSNNTSAFRGRAHSMLFNNFPGRYRGRYGLTSRNSGLVCRSGKASQARRKPLCPLTTRLPPTVPLHRKPHFTRSLRAHLMHPRSTPYPPPRSLTTITSTLHTLDNIFHCRKMYWLQYRLLRLL